jgi:tetratricopeptide (TPR) repeat protein
MTDRIRRLLKVIAAAAATLLVGWAVYGGRLVSPAPGDKAYLAGNRAFEDGDYAAAEAAYRDALEAAPQHIEALRGLALSLDRRRLHLRALATYDEAIAHEPRFGATYAHRGMLLDSLGRHEEALADYMRALELDPLIGEGPDWLTRFLRNQPAPPASVAERAEYLRAELAKPEQERRLQMPALGAQQR